jgi:D-3-phosphoglycerate dehydrogenase
MWRMLFTDGGEFGVPDDLMQTAHRAGVEIMIMPGHDPAEIAARGEHCHGLFLFRACIDDNLLAALPRCRVLARVGTGYDLIDVEAARRRNVMVTYVPEFCTEEMSDQVIMFVLAFARQVPRLLEAGHAHRWLTIADIPTPHRIAGRTLGLLGFGRTGQRTAEKARVFGLDVRVWTRTPRPDALTRTGARAATFEDVLGCDYVSLHIPLTPQTRGLIGRQALARFKPGAVLINTARGAIVDTGALVESLRAGRLAGAALDVVEPAPLPPAHPLWRLPNVWITSHSASLSVEALYESLAISLHDVIRMHDGLPPLHPVPELAVSGTTAAGIVSTTDVF